MRTATKDFTLLVQGDGAGGGPGGGGGLVIDSTSPLPTAEKGLAYSFTFKASGGVVPYHWTVVEGTLPVGLVLDSGGELHGNPNDSGDSQFTVQVTDASPDFSVE